MLTQDQIDSFHRDGYLVMRGVFHGRELAILQDGTEPVIAEGVARQGADHEYVRHPSGQDVYWRSNNMWRRGDIFRAVTLNPDLLENIGQCMGHLFFPLDDALVVKLAESGGPVRWHQDPPYGDPVFTETYVIPNFTVDIYLDHSGPENGCVWAIPGAHRSGHIDLSSRTQEELFEASGAVPVVMEPGDVMFHSLSIPHGSQAVERATRRRVFYLHYLAAPTFDALYRPWYAHGPDYKREGRNEANRTLQESMRQARRALGLEMPERETLRFTDEGIEFVGAPKTPPFAWAESPLRPDPGENPSVSARGDASPCGGGK